MNIRVVKVLGLPVALAVVAAVAFFATTSRSAAQGTQQSANGQGTLLVQNDDGDTVRRQFSLSARRYADGTVKGNAVLHNPAFTGVNGQRYQLQVDIRCMNVIGNVAFFGGLTRRTNDPNLVDAVYFSVQDNGEPGRGRDLISRAFFFDDDPNTQGDPQLCLFNQVGDFPMEPIDAGNIQVKNQ
ncbi:MAG TPA: hypothetical protein VF546_10515 [Pyrinomonadaceae bacterium]|jgi:hypothetical protein